MDPTRRALLGAVGSALTLGLAGCTGDDGAQTSTETATPVPADGTGQDEYPDYEWEQLTDPSPARTQTVTMENVSFSPLIATFQPGTELTVANEDGSSHTMTIPELDVELQVGAGEEASVTIDQTGTFDYVCTLHPPSMVGRLVVTDDPPTATAEGSTPTETDDGGELY